MGHERHFIQLMFNAQSLNTLWTFSNVNVHTSILVQYQSMTSNVVIILWQLFANKQSIIFADFDGDDVYVDDVDVDEDNDDEQPRRVIPVTPGSGHFAWGFPHSAEAKWGTLRYTGYTGVHWDTLGYTMHTEVDHTTLPGHHSMSQCMSSSSSSYVERYWCCHADDLIYIWAPSLDHLFQKLSPHHAKGFSTGGNWNLNLAQLFPTYRKPKLMPNELKKCSSLWS